MATVELAAVDDRVLTALLEVATRDAAADEVTSPVTDGPEWTEERRDWFRSFHRARREQLDGAAGEATWAILLDGRPVGCVRLKRTADPAALETGIWLARSVRGGGVGAAAIAAVLRRAWAAGARTVVADTTATNLAAQATMRRAGFLLAPPDAEGRVHGTVEPLGPSAEEDPVDPAESA